MFYWIDCNVLLTWILPGKAAEKSFDNFGCTLMLMLTSNLLSSDFESFLGKIKIQALIVGKKCWRFFHEMHFEFPETIPKKNKSSENRILMRLWIRGCGRKKMHLQNFCCYEITPKAREEKKTDSGSSSKVLYSWKFAIGKGR